MGRRSMVRTAVAVCLLTISASSVSGCLWRRARTNIADLHQRIGKGETGRTTTDELISILGSPPNNVFAIEGGRTVYLYTFGDSKTEGFNLILIEITKSNIGTDSAIFIADQSGVISEMFVSNNSQDLPWEFWAFGD